MGNCLRRILQRFVKKEIIAGADSTLKLTKIDVKAKENWLSYKNIDLGVAANVELGLCKVSDRDIMQLRIECLQFLSDMAAKIIERSPLKYRLVRFASSITPTVSSTLVASDPFI